MSWRMKRFYWLLAFPYVVTVSSPCIQNFEDSVLIPCTKYGTSYDIQKFGARFTDKDVAEDLAAALNEAHERRVEKKVKLIRATDVPGGTRFDFDYKSACGESDCGKEP